MADTKQTVSRGMKSLAFGGCVSLASICMLLGMAEFGFRLFPPTGIFSSGYLYDLDMGYRFKPNSKIIYNKKNGLVNHTSNREGWIDLDHDKKKKPFAFRIGFFGDSYVEGLSVPSEQHFFRNLPLLISDRPMEYFGFGRSGFGTVQSYLNSQKWTYHYDLDLIVYVFVENDIGDSISWIKKKENIPYAKKTTTEPGFSIVRTYQKPVKPTSSFFNDLSQIIETQSMLAKIINQRMTLLKQMKIPSSPEKTGPDLNISPHNKIPNSNDLAVTWPENIRVHAQDIAYRVLQAWANEIREAKKQFVVLYVPKGPKYLSQDSQMQNTFKGWLVNACQELNIPLLDPSKNLLAKHQDGIQVYRDHFTKAGHQVVSEFLENWLIVKLTPYEEHDLGR